jgi:hypothetical protein
MARKDKPDAGKDPKLRAQRVADALQGTPHWAIGKRAEAVLAVTIGLLTQAEACRQYGMTEKEFLACEQAIKRHGWLALQDPDLSPDNGSLMK